MKLKMKPNCEGYSFISTIIINFLSSSEEEMCRLQKYVFLYVVLACWNFSCGRFVAGLWVVVGCECTFAAS
jgi:hypothetical protein